MSDELNVIPLCVTVHICCALRAARYTNTTTAAALPFLLSLACSVAKMQTTKSPNATLCVMNTEDAGSTTSNFLRHLKHSWIRQSLCNVKVNFSAYGRLANMFRSAPTAGQGSVQFKFRIILH